MLPLSFLCHLDASCITYAVWTAEEKGSLFFTFLLYFVCELLNIALMKPLFSQLSKNIQIRKFTYIFTFVPFDRQDTVIQIRGDPEVSHHLSHHVLAQHPSKPEPETSSHVVYPQQAKETCVNPSATRPHCIVEVCRKDSFGKKNKNNKNLQPLTAKEITSRTEPTHIFLSNFTYIFQAKFFSFCL